MPQTEIRISCETSFVSTLNTVSSLSSSQLIFSPMLCGAIENKAYTTGNISLSLIFAPTQFSTTEYGEK
jgi:hypothetical protein